MVLGNRTVDLSQDYLLGYKEHFGRRILSICYRFVTKGSEQCPT